MGRATLTYSTEFGSICQDCEKPKDECTCNTSANPRDGINALRVSSTNKGRKGKTVTLVKGLRMIPSELKRYAGKLKKKTGTGGSLKDGVKEIQGDYRDKVGDILKKDGWDIK